MKNAIPENQLLLFDPLAIEKANELLDMLNDGLKNKEKYMGQYYYQEGDYYVFMAANRHKDAVFNILDTVGKTPEGMSANWRDINHIKQELNQI